MWVCVCFILLCLLKFKPKTTTYERKREKSKPTLLIFYNFKHDYYIQNSIKYTHIYIFIHTMNNEQTDEYEQQQQKYARIVSIDWAKKKIYIYILISTFLIKIKYCILEELDASEANRQLFVWLCHVMRIRAIYVQYSFSVNVFGCPIRIEKQN